MPKSICRGCLGLEDAYCRFCGIGVDEPPPDMVAIPRGHFHMGLNEAQRKTLALQVGKSISQLDFRREPERRILLARPVFMDRAPVTNRQFADFLAALGPDRRRELGLDKDDLPSDANPEAPVVNVTWWAACAYASHLNKRLPTEAEWESAAGWDPVCGIKHIFPWGDEVNVPALQNRSDQPRSVRAYQDDPAAERCIDMVGNVGQWCADIFEEQYTPLDYPCIPSGDTKDAKRTVRGGSCSAPPECCRVSWRVGMDVWERSGIVGFRCVKDVTSYSHG